MMGAAAQVLRPTEPKWFEGIRRLWAHSYGYDGTYVIDRTGHLWMRRYRVVYEYTDPHPNMLMELPAPIRRHLAEFKTQNEAKNYVETVWRMQAAGAFDPRGVE